MSVDASTVERVRRRGGPSFTSILGILFVALIAIILLRNLIDPRDGQQIPPGDW